MALTNTAKPSNDRAIYNSSALTYGDSTNYYNGQIGSFTNTARIGDAELWSTITTTWTTETRTWAQCISLLTNIAKVSSSIINTSKP